MSGVSRGIPYMNSSSSLRKWLKSTQGFVRPLNIFQRLNVRSKRSRRTHTEELEIRRVLTTLDLAAFSAADGTIYFGSDTSRIFEW
jgi:hypothetical protein